MRAEPTVDVEGMLAGLDRSLTELREWLETMRREVAELDGPNAPDHDGRGERGAGLEYLSLAPQPGTGAEPVDPSVAHLLYEQVCRRLRILPISLSDGVLTLATSDPDDRFAQNVAYALTQRPLRVVVVTP